MKYTELDLQIEDIMWFGIDKNGVVFEATSGGCANVPEFVINSKEDNEQLNDYFLGLDDGNAESTFLEELDPEYPAYNDCLSLTKNGITCFDVDDDDTDSYKKIAITSIPLTINNLPENITKILSTHVVDYDILAISKLSVEHGL